MSELCGPNADASGTRDPAAIFWYGCPRSHILRSGEFRRLGDTHVLATLWGGSWKDRLSEESKAAGTTVHGSNDPSTSTGAPPSPAAGCGLP